MLGYKFRLANGTDYRSGRVEMSIDGQWGTVCGISFFNNAAAQVLCRQLNFTGGRKLAMGTFGPGKGKIYINNLRCKGKEKSVMECPMTIEKDGRRSGGPEGLPYSRLYRYRYYSCWSHNDDAAVQCYDSGLSAHKYKKTCTQTSTALLLPCTYAS